MPKRLPPGVLPEGRVPLKDTPERVNKRTGRLRVPRPQVETLGHDHIYRDHFGELWQGSANALIGGRAQLFGDLLRTYSFEAVPGGFAFLFNVADPEQAVCVADLGDLPPRPQARAMALLAPLESALAALGFTIHSTP